MSELKSVTVSSRAERVTFFEDRARVERRARVQCDGPGMVTVRIEGVSVLIDDPGLIVSVAKAGASASVGAAQVRRLMRTASSQDASTIEALEDKVRASEQAYQEAAATVAQLELDRRQLTGLEDALIEQISVVPDAEGGTSTGWHEAFAALATRVEDLQQELQVARQIVARADREYRHQRLLLSDARIEEPEIVARVEVQLDAEKSGEVELVLEYFVPCALWRPSHRARLVGLKDNGEPRVEITTLATVWQATGEQWENVQCVFSTARLSKPSSAPLVSDDVLQVRTKSAEERKTIEVEAREQAIMRADTEGGIRAVDEMPGIDDGGKPLVFEASRPVTLPSDGEPFRVEVGATSLSARVESVAYAERAAVPHLRATLTWSAPYPLLAGPVTLIREREFAGQSRTDFVAIGDAFYLGFGPEAGVSVTRRVDEKRTQSRLTGKQTIEREVHVFLSNLTGEERRFELIERIPVSEIDEVVITADRAAAKPDGDGFVRIAIRLGPNESLERVLGYRVEFPAKVALNI